MGTETAERRRQRTRIFLTFVVLFVISIAIVGTYFIVQQGMSETKTMGTHFIAERTEFVLNYQLNYAAAERLSSDQVGFRNYMNNNLPEWATPLREGSMFVLVRARSNVIVPILAYDYSGAILLDTLPIDSSIARIFREAVSSGSPGSGEYVNWYGQEAIGSYNVLSISGELYVLVHWTDMQEMWEGVASYLLVLLVVMSGYIALIASYVRYSTNNLRLEAIENEKRLNVLLDHIDSLVFLSRPETCEIILANRKLMEAYELTESPVGKPCWAAMQRSPDGKCGDCSVDYLSMDSEGSTPITWEETNPKSGRVYRNVDSLLNWTDGSVVHMQQSIDITDLRIAEQESARQLLQQRLVTRLSLLFTSAGDFGLQMQQAMEQIGQFFHADAVYLMHYLKDSDRMHCSSLWQSGEVSLHLEVGNTYPYRNDTVQGEAFDRQEHYLFAEDGQESMESGLFARDEVQMGGIELPLFDVSGFVGYLGLRSKNSSSTWQNSDIFTLSLIRNSLRSAIGRNVLQSDLVSTQRTLRTVLDNVHLMIFWKDKESIYRGGNRAYFDHLKRLPEEVIGQMDGSFMPHDVARATRAEDARLFSGEIDIIDDVRFMPFGNKPSWVRIVKRPIYDQNDQPVSIIGIIEDVTDRKQAELRIRDAMSKLQAVISNYPGIIAVVGCDGVISIFDGQIVHSTEYDGLDLEGVPLDQMREGSEDGRILAGILQGILDSGTEEPHRVDFHGSTYTCNPVRLYDETGAISAMLVAATDITQMVELQHNLEEAIVTAQQASSAKTDFLSRMSHEIRTPMNAIIGMTKIALQTDERNRIRYALDRIMESSNHLLNLINDILDMSKIEANKLELVREPFNVERLLSEVCSVISVKADEKKLNLNVHIDPSLPRNYLGDALRLNQVILNLLSNAVKFTSERGNIDLSVAMSQRDGKTAQLRFTVKDTGIGIAPEALARVFNSFEQAEGSTTRRYGGSGLGLAICKRIVELMDGNIWVESVVNEGSSFHFTVRLGVDQNQDQTRLSDIIASDSLRLLVIDDSVELREYFVQILASVGIAADAASSGMEALQMIERALHNGNRYDIIFVDWRMPEMDGIETTKAIREILKDDDIIIIMISVTEWASIEKSAREAGIVHFLPKPLFPSNLMDTINRVLGGTVSRKEDTERIAPDLTGMTLLLVEDVEINREILAAVLEETHITIESAENGRIGVDMFEANPDRYDVIFMDIQMPEMDGYDATRLIRASAKPRGADIPIIAMTANVFKEDVDRCLAAGMDDHLVKPVDEERVLVKLAQLLGAKTHRTETEKVEDSKPRPALEAAHYAPYIDINAGMRIMRNNHKLYAHLLRSFSTNQLISQLEIALQEDDREEISALVHALKGVAGNLALKHLSEHLLLMESKLQYQSSGPSLCEAYRVISEQTVKAAEALILALSE